MTNEQFDKIIYTQNPDLSDCCSEETKAEIENSYFELFGEKLSLTNRNDAVEAMLLIEKARLKNGFYINISPEKAKELLKLTPPRLRDH